MKLKCVLAALAICACAKSGYAQTAGDFTVSVGLSRFVPQSSGYVFDKSIYFGAPTRHLPRAHVKASDANALSLSGAYFITDNLASEFILNSPARFSIRGMADYWVDGPDGSNPLLSTLEQSSYMLLLKYYFSEPEAKFRPFLGAGLSYNHFTKARFYGAMYLIDPLTPATLSVKDTWAPVLNGGLTYQFNKRCFASLSVSYMRLQPTAEVRADSKDFRSYSKFKFNPVITFLSIGYRL